MQLMTAALRKDRGVPRPVTAFNLIINGDDQARVDLLFGLTASDRWGLIAIGRPDSSAPAGQPLGAWSANPLRGMTPATCPTCS